MAPTKIGLRVQARINHRVFPGNWRINRISGDVKMM